jgi:hypothetical protein
MTTQPTHTPTPLGIREPFTDEEKRLNRIFITGKRTDGGQPTEDDFDFLELPYAPKGSPRREMAEYVVRAVNSHEELLTIVKAIAESFNAGADKVYAEALAPHTDDETLKTWINKAIARAEGGVI